MEYDGEKLVAKLDERKSTCTIRGVPAGYERSPPHRMAPLCCVASRLAS